jgi:hypothetical protein
MIPQKITINSDGSVLEFQHTEIKDSKGKTLPEPNHVYKYMKSLSKLGSVISLTEDQIFKIIETQKLFQ